MIQDKDQLTPSRTLSWTRGENIPETALYGEDNPEESHRLGYLLEFDTEHSPEDRARIVANVKAVAFSDVYGALEEENYRAISGETKVTTSRMYDNNPDMTELTEDVIGQIEKFGVDTGYDAVPPEGYGVMVSKPEG